MQGKFAYYVISERMAKWLAACYLTKLSKSKNKLCIQKQASACKSRPMKGSSPGA
jgi:hypothetical protein